MEQRKYSNELLTAIKAKETVISEDGLNILVKAIPDDDRPGVLDPRLYGSMAPMLNGVKVMETKATMESGANKKSDIQNAAEQMRQMMDSVKSIRITEGVTEERRTVKNGEVDVPVRIYTPEQKGGGLQPVFYYIHGGGFVAGGPEVVEEMCRLVVQNTGCVSVQVDYRLAPENSYPAGLDDCYAVLKWVYQNAAEFGGDPEKVCISGDSAGGNLATVCAMRDRDEGTHMVKVQALLYPSVDAAGMQEHTAHREVYEISDAQSMEVNALLDMVLSSVKGPTLGEFLGVEDDTHPYVSPLRGDLKGMAPTIILFGEYDFLRVENDAYAQKLKKAGVEVKTVRYHGLTHGFADQVGVTPQAEDSLIEIGNFMMEHLSKPESR